MVYNNFRRIPGTKLYRGSKPDDLDEKEKDKLEKEYGIKCVIDLRSPRECKHKKESVVTLNNHHFIDMIPSDNYAGVLWKECPWYLKCLYIIVAPFLLAFDMICGTIVHLRVVQGYAAMRNGLFGYSCDMAMYLGHKVKTALTLLCSEDNVPALIVCNLGKDRTGVLCSIVEALCEVSEEAIARDYSLSKDIGRPSYKRFEGRKRFYDELLEAKPETIINFLRFIDHKYGSLTAYLESFGFNQEMQKTLVQNIKEKR